MPANDLDPIILNAEKASTIFASHEYVAIKAEMKAGDDFAIQNLLAKVRQGDSEADAVINLHLGDVTEATLKRMIVGWQIDVNRRQPDGSIKKEPLPYSPANVAELPRKISKYVYDQMNRLYQGEDVQSQQNFTSDASAPTPGS